MRRAAERPERAELRVVAIDDVGRREPDVQDRDGEPDEAAALEHESRDALPQAQHHAIAKIIGARPPRAFSRSVEARARSHMQARFLGLGAVAGAIELAREDLATVCAYLSW